MVTSGRIEKKFKYEKISFMIDFLSTLVFEFQRDEENGHTLP